MINKVENNDFGSINKSCSNCNHLDIAYSISYYEF